MKRARTSRRNAVALAVSTAFHVVIVALIVSQTPPIYELPEQPAPPMDAQIVQMEEPPPPVVILHVPRLTPAPTKPAPSPVPPKPPPKPQPPTPPSPAKPLPQQTPVPNPVATPAAKPLPPRPDTPRPLPVAPPRTEPKPPAVTPAVPAPPTPAAPAPHPTPSPPAPMRLNIHKPEKDAPGNVPTLPLAPAPTTAASSGGPRTMEGGGEPALGGSRLSGLTPYPYGSMPSGGSGLRGSLVGCANADAVTLSSVEKARCNERFGREAGSAPALDPISPLKRAAFDKAAADQDANRRYRAAVPTGTTPGKPGFGAGLGPDQPAGLRSFIPPGP